MKTPAPCIECDEGTLTSVTEDYEILTVDGNRIIVPQVDFVRCDQCGETLIPAASSRRISKFQAQASEQLSQKELHQIFERTDLTQKEFAEALGLGEKTFHRWIKGNQVVSRSMGYYLRAMDRFPEVFRWVKERKWRSPDPVKQSKEALSEQMVVFTALARRETTRTTLTISSNPARGLVLEAVHHRS